MDNIHFVWGAWMSYFSLSTYLICYIAPDLVVYHCKIQMTQTIISWHMSKKATNLYYESQYFSGTNLQKTYCHSLNSALTSSVVSFFSFAEVLTYIASCSALFWKLFLAAAFTLLVIVTCRYFERTCLSSHLPHNIGTRLHKECFRTTLERSICKTSILQHSPDAFWAPLRSTTFLVQQSVLHFLQPIKFKDPKNEYFCALHWFRNSKTFPWIWSIPHYQKGLFLQKELWYWAQLSMYQVRITLALAFNFHTNLAFHALKSSEIIL